jgi:hypothetical protein
MARGDSTEIDTLKEGKRVNLFCEVIVYPKPTIVLIKAREIGTPSG